MAASHATPYAAAKPLLDFVNWLRMPPLRLPSDSPHRDEASLLMHQYVDTEDRKLAEQFARRKPVRGNWDQLPARRWGWASDFPPFVVRPYSRPAVNSALAHSP